MASMSAVNAARTHCNHGHEFTPENVRFSTEGWRMCRACLTARQRERRRRQRQENRGVSMGRGDVHLSPLDPTAIQRELERRGLTATAVFTENQQRMYYRSLRAGRITYEAADDLAITLRRHPSEIWGQQWA